MDKTLPEPPMNHSLSERRVMALPHQKGSTDGENFMEFNELPVSGHVLGKDDPANPQNLPVLTKIYVSIAAFALAFVVFVLMLPYFYLPANLFASAFGATSYTAGLKGVIERFDVSMQHSILGMSIYFWVWQFWDISFLSKASVVQNLMQHVMTGNLFRTYLHTSYLRKIWASACILVLHPFFRTIHSWCLFLAILRRFTCMPLHRRLARRPNAGSY